MLELIVLEVFDFFMDKKILKKIEVMEEVGIGYVMFG